MAGVHAMMISGGGGVTVGDIYLKPNGVTIAAQPTAEKGAWHSFMGKDYYVAVDYADLVSVVSVYKGLTGSGEVFANLNRDGQTKSIPLNQVVTTFVDTFVSGAYFSAIFYEAKVFNQDISSWDTGNVADMSHLFSYCVVFKQDLSSWCVSKIPVRPNNFDLGTPAEWTTAMKPKWGVSC